MMKQFEICGASDDIIQTKGILGCDEHGAYDVQRTFRIVSSEGRLRIHAIYDGCWCFAIGQVEEDDHVPCWELESSYEGYSQILIIKVPDDAALIKEWND